MVRARRVGGGDGAEYFPPLCLPPSFPSHELASVPHQAERPIKAAWWEQWVSFGE